MAPVEAASPAVEAAPVEVAVTVEAECTDTITIENHQNC